MSDPGWVSFEHHLDEMRSTDPETAEGGFAAIQERASEQIDNLIAAFATETDHGVRCWLLELVGDARSEKALPLLRWALTCDDEAFRRWALHGIHQLGTPEAKALWEDAKTLKFADEEETEAFREQIYWIEHPEEFDQWVKSFPLPEGPRDEPTLEEWRRRSPSRPCEIASLTPNMRSYRTYVRIDRVHPRSGIRASGRVTLPARPRARARGTGPCSRI